MAATPSRSSGPDQINQFNAWLKQQPWYQDFFASIGQDMNRVQLSRGQQAQLEAVLKQNGVPLGEGVHIDNAGNLNEKNRLVKNVGIGAGLTAATLATMGAAGAGPIAGMFGGGGGGVGAGGLGSGMGAAQAGAAAHAGSPLLMGSGALMPIGAGAGAAASLPTLASTPIGTGMGTSPSIFGPGASGGGLGPAAAAGAASGASSVGRGYGGKIADALGDGGGGLGDSAIRAALSALAGLPAALGNHGPSDEERGYQAQATRLLGQQEQRTQYQNPLYEAVTKMAYGLLPNMGNNGQPYPMNGLSDVAIPSMEDLIRGQRRT